ncbi:energy transducer TonB [Flavobacterium sp.]|uniref:energy transducer TonB n=1 Tax=Flavobacterium sp. TaxID=239 RepID=UPI0025F28C9F|nr:energy transducer TonB [Flavobacterium sp.]
MKIKLLYFFLPFSTFILAQNDQDKIVYLDSVNKETTIENHSYKRVIKEYYTEKSEYQVLEYYKSGTLKSEQKSNYKDDGYPIGEEIKYYENGQKKSSTFYENKRKIGIHTEWFENGNLKQIGKFNPEKFNTNEYYLVETIWNENGTKMVESGNGLFDVQKDKIHTKGEYKNGVKNGVWTITSIEKTYVDEYKDGNFISGYYTDKNGFMKEYQVLEKKPEPKKGLQHFYKFISSNFKPTREAVRNKVKGKIVLYFVVDKEGKISNIKIARGLGHGLDEEAINVLEKYPEWFPGEQRGIPVRCMYSLPITLDFSK